jgi:hypothetical protein
MQIGGESIENMFMNMMLEKKKFSKTQIQKNIFPCLFTQK